MTNQGGLASLNWTAFTPRQKDSELPGGEVGSFDGEHFIFQRDFL